MITLDKPLHTHDCDATHCTFLGNSGGADLYAYDGGLIARYSSDGPDYSSTSDAPVPRGEALREAWRRARLRDGVRRFTVPWMYSPDTRQNQADMLVDALELGEHALPIMLDAVTLIIHEHTGDTLARIDYDHDTY